MERNDAVYQDAKPGVWAHRASIVMALWLCYRVLLVAYRLSPLHPLYKIPGPLITRMTSLYEMYHDVIRGGRYTIEIKKMHDVYGPLIRIGPDQLHLNDPDFVEEVYAGSQRKTNKSPWHFSNMVGPLHSSAFATMDHDRHRARREALKRFFSRAGVAKAERELHGLAQQLGDKMLATGGEVFGFQDAASCFTSDGIGLHAFGDPLGFLQQQHGFVPNLKRASMPIFTTFWLFRWVHLFRDLSLVLGDYLAPFLPKELVEFKTLTDVEIPNRVKQIKAERDAKVVRPRATAFDAILDSNLPDEDKSDTRLIGEAGVFLIAGTDTSSWTLTVATYHLLRQPELLARVTREVRAAAAGLGARELPPWAALERLPLLGAVVSEALRLSYGLAGRSPRILHEDVPYRGGLVIPAGYAIGVSAWMLHHNEAVFPDSDRFLPERWLLDGAGGARARDLERYLFSFSKGARNCLGMNLAYCELYLALAMLILRVYPRLELYDTTIDDVKFDSDYFIPMIKAGREGVRVRVVME